MNPNAQVKFKSGGKEYALYMGNRALRLAEKELGFSVAKLGDDIGINDLTIMFWAGLQNHHSDITLDDVDDLFDELGHEEAGQIFSKAMEGAFSSKKQQQEKAKLKRKV